MGLLNWSKYLWLLRYLMVKIVDKKIAVKEDDIVKMTKNSLTSKNYQMEGVEVLIDRQAVIKRLERKELRGR